MHCIDFWNTGSGLCSPCHGDISEVLLDCLSTLDSQSNPVLSAMKPSFNTIPLSEFFEGHFYFDALSSIIDCPQPSWILFFPFLNLFWATSLFWNILQYCCTSYPPSVPPCRIRRHQRHLKQCSPLLLCLSASWMILSGTYMVHNAFYAGNIPSFPIPSASKLYHCIIDECNYTYHCIEKLDE